MATVLEQVCTSCGSAHLPDGRFCLFCGDLLSETGTGPSSSLTQSGSSSAALTDYAGFWLRAWAGLIDVTLEAGGALVLTLAIDLVLRRVGRMLGFAPWIPKVAVGMAYILVLIIGGWLYCAFMESSGQRATLGKRLVGLQVLTAEGGQMSFAQASVRHFMKFLSLFSAGFGFMMAGWTQRRQALHDIPSDCIVIRTPQERTVLTLRD
jgi:uncharacterized RDD family membrane protein YckC